MVYDAEHFFDGYKDDRGACACRRLEAAAEGGADCLVLCDTNGGTLPSEVMRDLPGGEGAAARGAVRDPHPQRLRARGGQRDRAVKAGAVQVQGTINGYGERTGNCNLTSVIPILQLKMGIEVVPDLRETAGAFRASWMTSRTTRISARAPFVGRTAFSHKGGMHVNAVQKVARSYEHIRAGGGRQPADHPGVRAVRAVEHPDQGGAARPAAGEGQRARPGACSARVKEREKEGYAYEAAGGSLELLIRRETRPVSEAFELKEYHCQLPPVQGRPRPGVRGDVKLDVDGRPEYTVAEGRGVVNALDAALRKALRPFYPEIDEVSLIDYKVRIIDGHDATAAKTRVLIVSSDGEEELGDGGGFGQHHRGQLDRPGGWSGPVFAARV